VDRATLAHQFATASTRWKTFVLEAHSLGESVALLQDAFGARAITATDDVYLHQLHADGFEFVVDDLDDRYWSLHTAAPMKQAYATLKTVVEARRDLDWMWLPSDHLREVWPGAVPGYLSTDFRAGRLTPESDEVADLNLRVRGRASANVLKVIEDHYKMAVSFSGVAVRASDIDLGFVSEAVSREGRFVASGDSFEFHQAIVRRFVDRYRRFIDAVEGNAIRWSALPEGGALPVGSPIVLRFSRPIPDFDLFLDHLFSAREPFRLWGIPELTGPSTAEVDAVDLHVGQQLRFDITANWIRVYLFAGGCGNTIARLASNLQHHFDGALSMVDESLNEELTLSDA
jgi:hypothetical protein